MGNGTRDNTNVQQIGANQDLSIVTTPAQELDSTSTGTNSWVNSMWPTYNGYYRKNQGGSKAAITQYAVWISGRGWTTDAATQKRLEKIKGNGRDTFKGILKNMLRVKKVGGDSFAEIVTSDNKKPAANGRNVINVKPLNAGSLEIHTSDAGIITHYRQLSNKGKPIGKKLEPWQIFHLQNDREGDEIHGISVYEGSTKMLDKIEQLDQDMTVVFHRFVMPFLIFKANTDKKGELDLLKAQLADSLNKGQGLIIPEKSLSTDDFKVPQFSTLNPLDWRKEWKGEAIKDLGMPELHLGSADGTNDASAKMVYFQFEQPVADEQEELEQQILSQLGFKLKLKAPLSIDENTTEDEAKDGNMDGKLADDLGKGKLKKEGKNPSNASVKKNL